MHALALIAVTASTRVALEAPAATGAWRQHAPLTDEELVAPLFMLRHDAAALRALEKLVVAVSDPDHPQYGQHLSAAQVAKALPPVAGAHAAVAAFLQEHAIPFETSASGDMVKAHVPHAAAKQLFATTFARFVHPETEAEIVRAVGGYTLPAELEPMVYLVGNLNEFPDVRRVQLVHDNEPSVGSFGSDCDSCSGKVTPQVLQQAYSLSAPMLGAGANMTGGMATAEFQGVMWTSPALSKFQADCHLKQTVKVDKQIGNNAPGRCRVPGVGMEICTEALLDIEYAKAVIGDTELTNIFSSQYSLLDWAKQVDDLGDAGPAVHSVSYGNDEVQQTSAVFMEAVNAQFMKVAARGVSVLFASGDQGVCGRSGCGGKFHPDFPAASPYVTAVGGTDFATRGVIGKEKAWSAGGGGFSDTFPTPDWQKAMVAKYLQSSGLPSASKFNATGRGYPDVAALGGQQNPYCVATQGLFRASMMGVAGTSAACPVFAGVVVKLNAARIAKGQPRLGWLNPWLYKNPQMFNDVTEGMNDAGSGSGFPAVAGWDAATGLGTPDFTKMMAAAVGQTTLVV